MNYYVYLLANHHNTVLYVGVTNDLARRVYEHKKHLDKGSFTDRYNVEKLVYFEVATDPYHAIEREKQIKSWNRRKKEKLIEEKIQNGSTYMLLSARGLPRQCAHWLAMTVFFTFLV